MYTEYFGLSELPFSIVPNSYYLFLSQRHKEAIQHIEDGLGEGGGFALLTGEVGTGKTTVAKAILGAIDHSTQTGFILNPTFSSLELLEAICDEFGVIYPERSTLKVLSQLIYQHLLDNHKLGKQTLLVIDEAQHLAADVLEQLRLLTNLETESRKLLKVLLVGQPELQHKLRMPQLRQLAQRITGRYHLLPLNLEETKNYITFRLERAGGRTPIFPNKSYKTICEYTQGIPRLINLVCDLSLKHAYQLGEKRPSLRTVELACQEVTALQGYAIYHPQKQAQSSQNASSPSWLGIVSAFAMSSALSYAVYLWLPTAMKPQLDSYARQQVPVVETETIYKEVLSNELIEILEQGDSFESGIKELYKVWGFKASVMDSFCQQSSSHQISCNKGVETLDEIANKGVPVLLTLVTRKQAENDGLMVSSDKRMSLNRHYAVLYQLSDTMVRLLVDGNLVQFERKWLSELWQGEFHAISKRYWNETLKPGMRGAPIELLNRHLSSVLEEPIESSDFYSESTKMKVEAFQQWQRLTVDGIAGSETLRRLESLSQLDVPSLEFLTMESSLQTENTVTLNLGETK